MALVVVPLHLMAFLLLYAGMTRLMHQEIVNGYSESTKVFARAVMAELHPLMESSRPSQIRQGLADFVSGHDLLGLELFDGKGEPIAAGTVPNPEVSQLLASNQETHFEIGESDSGSQLHGVVSITAGGSCDNCHQPGVVLGVAALSFDVTPFMSSARDRIRRNICLLVIGWATLVGGISLATKGLVRRSVRRLRAEVDSSSGERPAEIKEVPKLLLDPLSAELYASLRELLSNQRQREAQVASRLHHTDRLASIGQLAAGLAHEIKNPVAGLQGALEILRDETDDEEQSQLFKQMLAETQRVNCSLQSLLHFARPSRPQRVACDIGELLASPVQLLAPSFRRRGIKIETSVAPGMPRFSLDPEQIRQVLVNLVNNAAEAIETSGLIRLRATSLPKGDALPEGDGLIIAVSDDGPGIPSADRANLFEPFFTTKPYGTGLGLAVARTLVNRHGGHVDVTSEPGQGTVFLVVLPAANTGGGYPQAQDG